METHGPLPHLLCLLPSLSGSCHRVWQPHKKERTVLFHKEESTSKLENANTNTTNKKANPQDIIAENFVLLDLIGKGAFGEIFLSFDLRENLEVAIKQEKKQINKISQLKIEAKVYQKLLNIQLGQDISGSKKISQETILGVPKFYGVGESPDFYYLIML